MESSKKNLFSTFLSFSYGSIIVLILSFITTPIITRLYLPDEYGRTTIFNTCFSMLNSFIFLGLDQAFIRFYFDNDKKRLLKKTMILPLLISIVISIFFIFSRKIIMNYLFGEFLEYYIIVIIVRIISIVPNRIMLQSLRMEKKANAYSCINIIEKIIYILIATIGGIFYPHYPSLILAYVFSYFIATLIATVFLYFFVYKKSKKNKQDFILYETSNKEIFVYSLPLILHFALFWIIQSFDKIAIKEYLSYTELGIYTSAYTFSSALMVLQVVFTSFWTPISLEKYKINNDEVKEFFASTTNIVSFSMLLIGISICLFSRILVLLLGNEYRSAQNIIHLLCLIPVFYTISESTMNGIVFLKKSYLHIIISFISALICILLNIFLIPIFGIIGAAISTAIAYYFILILRTMFSVHLYKIKYNYFNLYVMSGLLLIFSITITIINRNIITIILSIIYMLLLIIEYKKTIIIIFECIKKSFRKKGC